MLVVVGPILMGQSGFWEGLSDIRGLIKKTSEIKPCRGLIIIYQGKIRHQGLKTSGFYFNRPR